MKYLFSPSSPLARLFLTLFITIGSLLTMIFLSNFLAIWIFEISFFELTTLTSNLEDEKTGVILKFLHFFNTLGFFIFPPLIITWLLNYKLTNYYFLSNRLKFKIIGLTIIILIASIPLINALVKWNENMNLPQVFDSIESWMRQKEEFNAQLTKLFINVDSWREYFINIFLIAAMAAIGEELFFRGLLLRQIKDITHNWHIAIWISAIAFSAIHMQFYGFFPRLLLGALFGYMVLWSGSLWPSMIAHFINNGIGVTFAFLETKGFSSKIDSLGTNPNTLIWLFVSLFAVAFFTWLFYQEGIKQKGTSFGED